MSQARSRVRTVAVVVRVVGLLLGVMTAVLGLLSFLPAGSGGGEEAEPEGLTRPLFVLAFFVCACATLAWIGLLTFERSRRKRSP